MTPVRARPPSDLVVAQPVTWESMRQARAHAAGQVEVSLLSAQYPDERDLVPDGFVPLRDLDRSVAELARFERPRRLPLLADVLDRLHAECEADYLVYTNSDIAVMPHFYLALARLIAQGLDGIVVNRRSITDRWSDLADLPLMYAEVGTPHEGHDCFVFRRDAYPRYRLAAISVGVTWIGRALLWNVAGHATRFLELRDHHLTFHIGAGNMVLYAGDAMAEYRLHNLRELARLRAELETTVGPFPRHPVLAPYLDWVPGPDGRVVRPPLDRTRRLVRRLVSRLTGR